MSRRSNTVSTRRKKIRKHIEDSRYKRAETMLGRPPNNLREARRIITMKVNSQSKDGGNEQAKRDALKGAGGEYKPSIMTLQPLPLDRIRVDNHNSIPELVITEREDPIDNDILQHEMTIHQINYDMWNEEDIRVA